MADNERSYSYTDGFGDTYTVYPKLNMYLDNDNLYVGLDCMDPEDGFIEPYTDLTVNVGRLPYLESAIDITYGGDEKIKFLTENGFGQLTGHAIPSGFCVFPVFRFNEDKLREIDPVTFADYAKAHGVEVSKDLDTVIKSAEQKATGSPEQGNQRSDIDRSERL